MLDLNDWQEVEIAGTTLRVRKPEDPTSHKVLIAFHGWTGDENSTLIFSRKLPEDLWIFAPRGLVQASTGGYGWVDVEAEPGADFRQYQLAAEQVSEKIPSWLEHFNLPIQPLDLMGFSQGAALALMLIIANPQSVQRVAGLAGFLPLNTPIPPEHLRGKSIFIAHGSRDETVPVELARVTVETLKKAGADVTYCEDEVGHKLSASCFSALGSFFRG